MTVINQVDLDGWCNCGNFPAQKCDECKVLLGDVTHIPEGKALVVKEKYVNSTDFFYGRKNKDVDVADREFVDKMIIDFVCIGGAMTSHNF